jgi:hypothetical protein
MLTKGAGAVLSPEFEVPAELGAVKEGLEAGGGLPCYRQVIAELPMATLQLLESLGPVAGGEP